MRTRFLTPNYFTAASTAGETLEFLRLPLSPLSHQPIASSDELLGRCFNDLSAIVVSLDLENLPINDALSKFYFDVLPHSIDAYYDGDFPVASNPSYGDFQISEKEAELLSEEKENQDDLALDFERPENESVKERDMDACDKNDNNAVIIQFETPELNQYPENVCMSEEEEVQFLPELQYCDVDLEMFNIVSTDPFSCDNEDYANPVEASCVEYDATLELQMPDGVYLLPNNTDLNESTFPLLEVEEIGPIDFSFLCLEDAWCSLFGTIEELHSVHSVDLELCCQDLHASVEIDILELIYDSHSSKMALETCFTSLNLAPDIDLLRVIGTSYSEVIGTSYSEQSTVFVDTPGTPLVPFLFEEFKMLDSVSFDIFEVLVICQPAEVTDLCNMFLRDMPSKSFDELVVSSELAVIDGTFTSLSVPDIVDDEKIMSLHVIVDNLLAELEPVPFSMSDEIYLDWHLLGRDDSSGDVSVAFEKVLNDLRDYTMDSDLNFDDDNTVVLHFLLADNPSDEMNKTEDKVTMPSIISCSAKHQKDKFASRILPDDDCQIIESNGNLTKADFVKFESGKLFDDDCQIIEYDGKCDGLQKLVSSAVPMPKFNDLDFFLNPKTAAVGMGISHKVKSLDAKSMLSRGPYNKTAPFCSMQKQQKLEEVLNFPPIKFSEAPGDSDTSCRPISCCMAQESKIVHPSDLSLSDMIVIVNTQNFDKEMIISRRSTYQKILTLEKRGIQVVERDLIMPVDIILDFTTCIVWYDCKNIAKKANVQDENTSSISLCMENIAANTLTYLSFAFTTCILIFEGESNFLGPVMESADELYAAAAGLGTNLQIFCSYSIELSDDIILNYIGRLRNSNEGLLSRLPESETLAESFLTKFPSISPLSAQAIASSGCMLLEFFELTAEGRVQVLRKYHISDESVHLFSALCKYGEREESKSGVTDCSSSISSPPDSGNFVRKINSEDRKRKFVPSSCDGTSDFRYATPCNTYEDDELNNQGMLRPSVSKVSKSPRISLQKKLPAFSLDSELFCEGDAPNTTKNMDPSKAWCETSKSGSAKVSQMADDFVRSTFLVNDGYSSQQKPDREIKNKREECVADILQDMHEDCVGNVLDFSNNFLFDGDFMINEKSVKSSPMVSEAMKDHTFRHDSTARRLSFDISCSDLNLSMVDAMDLRCGLDDTRNVRTNNNFNDLEYEWSNNSFKTKERQEWSVRSPQEKSMENFTGELLKGKNEPPYVETPLSKAVHSEQPQQGSPWTIEFLNRIKEKRRSRQQIPPYASVLRNSNPGNVTKATKRRSPSILEYYKYQSDGTSRKKAEQNLQKQHAQPQNVRQSGLCPTWTPNDKRARRSLSFATTGTGSQTKLVWSDNISCNQDNRFSNRV